MSAFDLAAIRARCGEASKLYARNANDIDADDMAMADAQAHADRHALVRRVGELEARIARDDAELEVYRRGVQKLGIRNFKTPRDWRDACDALNVEAEKAGRP